MKTYNYIIKLEKNGLSEPRELWGGRVQSGREDREMEQGSNKTKLHENAIRKPVTLHANKKVKLKFKIISFVDHIYTREIYWVQNE